MKGCGTSVKIESSSDYNFGPWKQGNLLILALFDLDQYIEEEGSDDYDYRKEWMGGDRKDRAVIGLSISDEHLEHTAVKYTV